jgi:hypothetical protein
LVSLLAAAATTKYQPVTPVGGRTASDMESSASGSEDSDNDSGGDFDGTDDSAIDGLGLPRNTRKKRKRDPERGAGSRKTRSFHAFLRCSSVYFPLLFAILSILTTLLRKYRAVMAPGI